MAYYPRVHAKRMRPRIRGWPETDSKQPKLLAHAGFKAGCVQIVSIDDRKNVPNHGKQLVTLGTVIATPPAIVLGVRGYTKDFDGKHAAFDIMADNLPKRITKYMPKKTGSSAESARSALPNVIEIVAILAASPAEAGLEQKKPYIFEATVRGGTITERFDYAMELQGKSVKLDEVFDEGSMIDVAAISKGKGWQGVIQRMGAKRKQHKSRKTVRELGSLGPISPQNVMYTVPRAGQMGFHQRVEYSKRIMVVGHADSDKINPSGGFKHFGEVPGDYIIVKGSVPGTYKRLINLRAPVRNVPAKTLKPNVLEVII